MPRGRTSTEQLAISIRCAAEALSATWPSSASGREVDDQHVGLLVGHRRYRRAERFGQRVGGRARAAVGVADRDDLLHAHLGIVGQADGRDRDSHRTALQQLLSRVADRDVAVRGVRVRAEHDRAGALALGERAQALGRGAVGDDVARDARVAEQRRSPLQELLGVALGELLAAEVRVLGVAHVGERRLGARAGEHATESDRVVLVGGAVIGNDDLG